MRKAVLTAVLVSLGAVWGLVNDAQAFGHKVRTTCIAYYPGLYSFAPCGCGYPPYVYPCTYRYPKYCGHRKSCWRGYLTGGCLPPGYACRYGCGAGCGSACDGGCGSCGGCGDGCSVGCGNGCGSCGDGCDGCGDGDSYSPSVSSPSTYETDEKVLDDGPAPGPETAPQPEADPADPTASSRQSTFRLAAATGRDGTPAFTRGLQSYWDNNMNEALRAFDAAAAAEPQNALYQYYRALTFYNLQGPDAAGEWLQHAVELERQAPVENYGRRMERVQGPARLWIEQARTDAGLGAK